MTSMSAIAAVRTGELFPEDAGEVDAPVAAVAGVAAHALEVHEGVRLPQVHPGLGGLLRAQWDRLDTESLVQGRGRGQG